MPRTDVSKTGRAATTDFMSTVWRKLCVNAAGILNALLLLLIGPPLGRASRILPLL